MAQIAALTGNANPNFAIGPNGATNPTLSADGSVASAATGVKVKGNAAAAGADLFVTSSGTNENLRIDAKGSGAVDIGTNSTGDIGLKRNTAVTGTLGVSSDVAINTNKFTVAGSSGNTAVAGTLGVAGDVAVNTNKFVVTASTGKVVAAGAIECQTSLKIGAVTLSEANLTALLALLS